MLRGRQVAALLAGLALGLGAGLSLLWQATPSDGGTLTVGASTAASTLPVLEGEAVAPLVGARAPDFALVDLEGRSRRLSGEMGWVVVLNFWGTWCEPCRSELALLETAYRARGPDSLQVLAVNADEPREQVAAFRDEVGLTLPVLLDPGGEVQRLYRVFAYPTTYVIDAGGIIRAIEIGVLDEARLERALEAAGLEAE